MSGVSVTAVHTQDDDEAESSTPRLSVASLVSRFSQKKLSYAPFSGSHSPAGPQTGDRTPPPTAPKPGKKGDTTTETAPETEVLRHTQDNNGDSIDSGKHLKPRLSVSDLAKSLGKDISVAVEKQIKKNQPHVSVIQSHSSSKKVQSDSSTKAEVPERKLEEAPSTNDRDSKTGEQEVVNDTPDSSFTDFNETLPDIPGIAPQPSGTDSIFGSSEDGGKSADTSSPLRSDFFSTPETTQVSASIRVTCDATSTSNTIAPSSSHQAEDDRNRQTDATSRQQVSVQTPPTATRQRFPSPSSPVDLPPPPEMGAPPPYSPGPADTYVPRGVEAEATSGPGVQASVSNTAARIGSGILQGMRRQSEQNQHHVSFGTSPFDDDFVPSPPVTQERRRSTGPEPVSFHAVCGRNASVSADQLEARRVQTEFRNAYIFTATPVTLGQQIVLKILSVDSLSRINGMAFGMTACDPAHIVASTLPDDADLLLDRLEYWVVVQDVCLNPEVGDEICISVSPDGEVMYSRNGGRASTLMHVDYTVPLWAFFDISGHALKIKSIAPASARRGSLRRASSGESSHTHTLQLSPVEAGQHVQGQGQGHGDDRQEECSVCFERAIDTVLYTCGHMCMCYECSVAMKEGRDGLCPICRQTIVEVIKVYRT